MTDDTDIKLETTHGLRTRPISKSRARRRMVMSSSSKHENTVIRISWSISGLNCITFDIPSSPRYFTADGQYNVRELQLWNPAETTMLSITQQFWSGSSTNSLSFSTARRMIPECSRRPIVTVRTHSYCSDLAGVVVISVVRGSTSFLPKRGSCCVNAPNCGPRYKHLRTNAK